MPPPVPNWLSVLNKILEFSVVKPFVSICHISASGFDEELLEYALQILMNCSLIIKSYLQSGPSWEQPTMKAWFPTMSELWLYLFLLRLPRRLHSKFINRATMSWVLIPPIINAASKVVIVEYSAIKLKKFLIWFNIKTITHSIPANG